MTSTVPSSKISSATAVTNSCDSLMTDTTRSALAHRVRVSRLRGRAAHEEAMENSNLPVTQEFSQKMMALADGPPTFYNVDVIDDRS